jgi:hypothetical protein
LGFGKEAHGLCQDRIHGIQAAKREKKREKRENLERDSNF